MPEKIVTKRRPIWQDKRAVTPALGVILLMPTLLIAGMAGATMLTNMADWSNAEADRAHFYAECARAEVDDNFTPDPACPGYEEWERPGWECKEYEDSVHCEREEPKDHDIQVT